MEGIIVILLGIFDRLKYSVPRDIHKSFTKPKMVTINSIHLFLGQKTKQARRESAQRFGIGKSCEVEHILVMTPPTRDNNALSIP
jgi:hypothetical protein